MRIITSVITSFHPQMSIYLLTKSHNFFAAFFVKISLRIIECKMQRKGNWFLCPLIFHSFYNGDIES